MIQEIKIPSGIKNCVLYSLTKNLLQIVRRLPHKIDIFLNVGSKQAIQF